jgi:hypothetical protein
MELNNFLKDRLEKDKNLQIIDVVPEFLFKYDEIINELLNIDKEDLHELFTGVFLSLNQLGEKLFDNNSNSSLLEEFKLKVQNYNIKSEAALFKINDLILSDLLTAMDTEFKENGLKPFYNEKLRYKKPKQSSI